MEPVDVQLDHEMAGIAADGVALDVELLLHAAQADEARFGVVVVEDVVGDVEAGKVAVDRQLEVAVGAEHAVADVDAVREVFVVLPHVRQAHVESSCNRTHYHHFFYFFHWI